MNGKRIGLATVFGFCCGIICLMLGHFVGGTPWGVTFILAGLVNRTMMGFVIGVCSLKMNPFLRGPLFGLLMSLGPAIAMGMPNMVPYLVAGTIYGLLIDALTTKAFKADVA